MFSGVLHLELLIDKTPKGTLVALMNYCSSYDIPDILVLDEGTEF